MKVPEDLHTALSHIRDVGDLTEMRCSLQETCQLFQYMRDYKLIQGNPFVERMTLTELGELALKDGQL